VESWLGVGEGNSPSIARATAAGKEIDQAADPVKPGQGFVAVFGAHHFNLLKDGHDRCQQAIKDSGHRNNPMKISDSDQMVANIHRLRRFCQSVVYKFRPVLRNITMITSPPNN
jgi:hypothetical protein